MPFIGSKYVTVTFEGGFGSLTVFPRCLGWISGGSFTTRKGERREICGKFLPSLGLRLQYSEETNTFRIDIINRSNLDKQ